MVVWSNKIYARNHTSSDHWAPYCWYLCSYQSSTCWCAVLVVTTQVLHGDLEGELLASVPLTVRLLLALSSSTSSTSFYAACNKDKDKSFLIFGQVTSCARLFSRIFLHQLDLYQWPWHATIINPATWSVLVDSNTLSIVFGRYVSKIVLLFYVRVLVQIQNVVTNFFRNTFLHF